MPTPEEPSASDADAPVASPSIFRFASRASAEAKHTANCNSFKGEDGQSVSLPEEDEDEKANRETRLKRRPHIFASSPIVSDDELAFLTRSVSMNVCTYWNKVWYSSSPSSIIKHRSVIFTIVEKHSTYQKRWTIGYAGKRSFSFSKAHSDAAR